MRSRILIVIGLAMSAAALSGCLTLPPLPAPVAECAVLTAALPVAASDKSREPPGKLSTTAMPLGWAGLGMPLEAHGAGGRFLDLAACPGFTETARRLGWTPKAPPSPMPGPATYGLDWFTRPHFSADGRSAAFSLLAADGQRSDSFHAERRPDGGWTVTGTVVDERVTTD